MAYDDLEGLPSDVRAAILAERARLQPRSTIQSPSVRNSPLLTGLRRITNALQQPVVRPPAAPPPPQSSVETARQQTGSSQVRPTPPAPVPQSPQMRPPPLGAGTGPYRPPQPIIPSQPVSPYEQGNVAYRVPGQQEVWRDMGTGISPEELAYLPSDVLANMAANAPMSMYPRAQPQLSRKEQLAAGIDRNPTVAPLRKTDAVGTNDVIDSTGGYEDWGDGGGGGGGGGDGGGGVPAEVAIPVPEPLPEVNWWTPDMVPVQIREWATWFQELFNVNKVTGALPWLFEGLESIEGNPLLNTPLFQRLMRLMLRMGLTPGDNMDVMNRWQMFVNAIPFADLQTQQELAALNYDADAGWYFKDIPQLYNPMYT